MARVIMNIFDALFIGKLEELKIETLLKLRYIDDLRVVLRRILAGVTLRGGGLVVDKELEEMEKDDITGEKTTARLLLEVMNSLVEGIVFTAETKEDFPDDWGLPTLDTQWRMVEDEGWSKRIQYP